MAKQQDVLLEAFRVLLPDGYICIIQPDMTFSRRGGIDPTHTTEWSADEFLLWLQGDFATACESKYGFEIYAHNTLGNSFSFDTVLRKK